jgi:hypothetical protein
VPGAGGQQRGGRLAGHTGQGQRGQVGRVQVPRLAVAGGEQQDDAFGLQPAGAEQQRRRRGVVEPVRVIDDGDHRAVLGGIGEQAQRAEEGQEPVAVPAGLAERRPQGRLLRRGQRADPAAQRPQQPLQRGEGQR